MNSVDVSYEMHRYFDLLIKTLTDRSAKMAGEKKEGLNEAIHVIEIMLNEFEESMNN